MAKQAVKKVVKKAALLILPDEIVMNKIYFIREYRVILDSDLADLYTVENKQLKRQVRRNRERFPSDFMFALTKQEYDSLRSQIGTLKRGKHSKFLPFAFTEQGVAMLSSVLNSKQAIQVNIQIMRIFTHVRKMLVDNTELRLAIEEIRKKADNNTKNIEVVFKYLDELIEKEVNPTPRELIGYKSPKKKL